MRSRPAISASGRSACQWKVKCQTSSVLHVSSIVSPSMIHLHGLNSPYAFVPG